MISGSAPSSTLLGQPSLQLLNIFMFAALNIFRMSWFRVNYPNTARLLGPRANHRDRLGAGLGASLGDESASWWRKLSSDSLQV